MLLSTGFINGTTQKNVNDGNKQRNVNQQNEDKWQ